MIKVSHECPIGLLEQSLEFNDYQYCLVHLLEEQPEYKKHFQNCISRGIEVILDNSIFELEEAFESDKFEAAVRELKPDWYIIPDVLENHKQTVANLSEWYSKGRLVPGSKTIAVVQGKTYEELKQCYKTIDNMGVSKIAISFNYSWYEKEYPFENKLYSWMIGRRELLKRLDEDGVLNKERPHHLLGASLPQEGQFYKNMPWIDSVDTSNPVVHAIKDIPYDSVRGLETKASQKLFELINYPVEDINQSILDYNLKMFKQIWQ